jgi:hypothetical protein
MAVEGSGAEAPATEAVSTETVETQEVETEQQAEESPSTDDFAKKFAALSRREKDVRTKEQDYEQKLAELQAKYDAVAPKQEEVSQEEESLPLEYRLKRNPLKTLEELGFGYEKLTELALNDGKLPPEMQMKLMREELESDYKKKFEALEEKLTAKELQEQEQKYDTVVNNFKNEIKELVTSDAEKYELINASDSQELVFDIISQHYEETNRILPIEEAAQAVEDHLVEEFGKYSNLKKLSKGTEAQEPSLDQLRQSPTLSNDLSAQSVNNTDKKLSDEESKALIAKMIKWEE